MSSPTNNHNRTPGYPYLPISPIDETPSHFDQSLTTNNRLVSSEDVSPITVSDASWRDELNQRLGLHDNSSSRDETDNDGSRHEIATEKESPTYWNPFWLSRTFLCCFAAVITILGGATVLLWRISLRTDGFPLLTTKHYAWTYGPTAVLVIVSSFWRQVDYWCKLLQPWQDLQRGWSGAETSVLLDYLSPMFPVGLWRAGCMRHGTIIITIAGGLLLKLVTIASTGFLFPLGFPSTGLHIFPLSSWLMVGGFLAIILGTTALSFMRPYSVVPCRMGSISGTALIVSRSVRFQNLLRYSGHLQRENIEKTVLDHSFKTDPRPEVDGITRIWIAAKTSNEVGDGTKRTSNQPKIVWWRPLPITPTIFALISALPLALIVVMEVLQHFSNQPDGIAIIGDSTSFMTLFGTRYIPSLVFISVAGFYDSISFNVSLLAPFHKLKKGGVKAETSIDENFVGKMTPHALFSALRFQHWAAAAAILASFLDSFLIIIVSGLYSIETTPGPAQVAMQRVDQFDLVWSDSLMDDGGAAVRLRGFEMSNSSYTPLTTAELAFPTMKLPPESMNQISKSQHSSITVRLPALRADLNCPITSRDDINVNVSNVVDTQGSMFIRGSAPIPPECLVDTRTVDWQLQYNVNYSLMGASGWVGQMQNLDVGLVIGDTLRTGERNASFHETSNPPGCPSLAFTFGNYSSNDRNPIVPATEITTMWCYQYMTEVDTDATLRVPDFTVISATPDETTVKYLPAGPNGETAFQYRPQMHFAVWEDNGTFGGSRSSLFTEEYPNPNYVFDGFFSLMLHTEDGVEPLEVWEWQNHNHLVAAIKTVYRRYMAQVATSKMRVPINGTSASNTETISATWVNSKRGILRQNKESKIALQAILGVMFLCGLAAYFLIDSKELLPHNPCSIAGLASLLAGSNMCDERRRDSIDGSTGSDWTRAGVWDYWTFCLGWWNSGAGESRRFGIDVGHPVRERLSGTENA